MAGDWFVRGLDFETYLVGQVTDKIIDADRRVRAEWQNGFPNWALYRTVYAGDSHLRQTLRDWCVAFAIAAAESGLIRTGLPTEEMGALAGWDAFYRLNNHEWLIAGQDIADVAGVDPKTYRKLRNYVYTRNKASMDEYFVRLQIAVREVWMRDRWVEPEAPRGKWGWGSGFDGAIDMTGTGCYRVKPSTMSDKL